MATSIQETPGRKRSFTVALDAETVARWEHMDAPLAMNLTALFAKGKIIWHLLWGSPGAHIEKKTKTTEAAESHERVLKVGFCCCCNYSLCFHIFSSTAHRNHMEPSRINSAREEESLCLDCKLMSLNLYTFLFPLLTTVLACLIFVIKDPTRSSLDKEDCILDDSLQRDTVPSWQRRQDHKAATHTTARRQRSSSKGGKESSRTLFLHRGSTS